MDLDREQQQVEVRLRALVGDWDDGSPVFLGAVESDLWGDLPFTEWEAMCDRWRIDGPGTTQTREVDVTLSVPADLFSTPQLSATAQEVNDD